LIKEIVNKIREKHNLKKDVSVEKTESEKKKEKK
jgi:hypothetical protein